MQNYKLWREVKKKTELAWSSPFRRSALDCSVIGEEEEKEGGGGLKASTEENLVRDKEHNMFCFTRKTQEFHIGNMNTRYVALFLCP